MFNNLTVKARLFSLIAFFALMLAVTGFIGLKGMNNSNEGLRTVYLDRTVPLDQLAEITDLTADSIIQLNLAGMQSSNVTQGAADPRPISKHIDKVEQNIAAITKLWGAYTATYLMPEEKILVDEYAQLRKNYREKGLKPTMELLKQGRAAEAIAYMNTTVYPLYEAVIGKCGELKNLQVRVAKEEYEKATANYNSTRLISFLVMLSAIGIGLIIGFIIVRKLMSQLGGEPAYAAEAVKRVSHGDFTMNLEVKPGDKSSLMYRLKNMQKIINDFIASQNTMAQHHADGMISEMMWADAFPGTFGKMAHQLNDIVGSHIAVKMRLVEITSEYAKGNFSTDMDRLPGEKAKLTETMDFAKNTMLAVSNELTMLCEAGAAGDFSKRGDAGKFEFVYKDILNNFNRMLETCDTGFDDVLRVSQALAKGDLTQTISRDYPGSLGLMKDGVNTTVDNLKVIVGSIQDSANHINNGAKEIASGNNDLSHRTEEQAASLEQTAASMEQLTSTVQHNAANAKQASQLASDASTVAGKGVEVVGLVVSTMDEINDSSRRIADIISVIDDIAFQTNILALNAAVEAARAGEQGRGFAVVAVEVRNLAQRAAAAAGEIKILIDDSVTKVSGGSKLVEQAGLTMEEIVKSIHGVTIMMSEISAASAEQSAGIEQVNQAIGQMDDVTQQNAALVEQAAAAAESLEEQAQSLSDTVAQFKVDGYSRAAQGSATQARAAHTPPPARAVAAVKPAAAKPVLALQSASDDWEEF